MVSLQRYQEILQSTSSKITTEKATLVDNAYWFCTKCIKFVWCSDLVSAIINNFSVTNDINHESIMLENAIHHNSHIPFTGFASKTKIVIKLLK